MSNLGYRMKRSAFPFGTDVLPLSDQVRIMTYLFRTYLLMRW